MWLWACDSRAHYGGSVWQEAAHLLTTSRERKRGRSWCSSITFKEMAQMAHLDPTRLHLLTVPLPPVSATSWDPSLQHMTLQGTYQIQPRSICCSLMCLAQLSLVWTWLMPACFSLNSLDHSLPLPNEGIISDPFCNWALHNLKTDSERDTMGKRCLGVHVSFPKQLESGLLS